MGKSLPNDKELEVLTLFYNRFYDLYEEITNDNFFKENAQLRFFKLREAFSIYKELLSYEPIKSYLEWMKRGGSPLLKVLSQMVYLALYEIYYYTFLFLKPGMKYM